LTHMTSCVPLYYIYIHVYVCLKNCCATVIDYLPFTAVKTSFFQMHVYFSVFAGQQKDGLGVKVDSVPVSVKVKSARVILVATFMK